MFRATCVYGTEELLNKEITTSDITRPGLEMTGYFDYYSPERIQLIDEGVVLCHGHDPSQPPSGFPPNVSTRNTGAIVARGLTVPEEMFQAAKENKIAIFQSKSATSRLAGELSSYLDSRLAKWTSVHGVLMDIYGMGVLIQGDSGIGKSETGLELSSVGTGLSLMTA